MDQEVVLTEVGGFHLIVRRLSQVFVEGAEIGAQAGLREEQNGNVRRRAFSHGVAQDLVLRIAAA